MALNGGDGVQDELGEDGAGEGDVGARWHDDEGVMLFNGVGLGFCVEATWETNGELVWFGLGLFCWEWDLF